MFCVCWVRFGIKYVYTFLKENPHEANIVGVGVYVCVFMCVCVKFDMEVRESQLLASLSALKLQMHI